MDLGQAFLDESRRYLAREYAVKIRLCLAELSDEDLWWRPNEQRTALATCSCTSPGTSGSGS